MKYQFFAISARHYIEGMEELNRFCGQNTVATVEKHFVPNGDNSFWSVCITLADDNEKESTKKTKSRQSKVDYKEILSDDDFTIYARLRDLRKSIAESEGTPAYNVFTNEQLAKIVQNKASSKSAFMEIEGIGKTRIEKYADIFIEKLSELI